MPQVVSTHPLYPRAHALLAPHAEISVVEDHTAAGLVAGVRDADVIIVRAHLPPELFDAPRLRAAIRHGAGLDMIPVEAATQAGVLVANAPGLNATTVAEHVIFAAIALLRRFPVVQRDLHKDGWFAGRAHSTQGQDLAGRKLGVIGYGNVGRAVARRAAAFDMTILACDPSCNNFDSSVQGRDFEEVISTCDIVALTCPLTEQTRGLFSMDVFSKMKDNAFLINVARGPIVNSSALLAALESGKIAGAALDVFENQPLDPTDPLFHMDNVILTPHMAGVTSDSLERLGVAAVEETLRILQGETPINFINPDALERHRLRFPGALLTG